MKMNFSMMELKSSLGLLTEVKKEAPKRKPMSWKGFLLPRCEKLIITRKEYDQFIEAWGLKRVRYREFEKFHEGGKHPNDFLLKAYKSLERYAEEAATRTPKEALIWREKYDKLSDKLLKFSRAFRLVGLHSVSPGWYKYSSLKRIVHVLKRLSKVCRGMDLTTKFERIMMLKPECKVEMRGEEYWFKRPKGAWRPVSRPTLEWRAYNRMQYLILAIWMRPTHADYQHGATPERGCVSAWDSLEPKLRRFKFIYEFDLAKFFDTVNWWQITRTMTKVKYPFRKAMWLKEHIEQTMRNLPEIVYWNERREKTISLLSRMRELFRENKPIPKRLVNLRHNIDLAERIARENKTKVLIHADTEMGIPQGDGLSPMIACRTLQLALEENNFPLDRILMYMDDGLLFADSQSEMDDLLRKFELAVEQSGSSINYEKSRRVRKNGVWEKELKFLGYRWKQEQEWMESDTRSGKRIPLPKADKNLLPPDYQGRTAKVALAGLNEFEIARRYRLLSFLMAYGWGSINKHDGELRRLLHVERKSFLSHVLKDGSNLRDRIAYANLANASTIAVSTLLRRWTYYMTQVGRKYYPNGGHPRRRKQR